MRKATFYRVKGRVLQCKTRPFAEALIIRQLQSGGRWRQKSCLAGVYAERVEAVGERICDGEAVQVADGFDKGEAEAG